MRRFLALTAAGATILAVILLWPYLVGGTVAVVCWRTMRRRAYPELTERGRGGPGWLGALALDLVLLGGVEGLRARRKRLSS